MAMVLSFERFLDAHEVRIKYDALALACAQLGAAGRPHRARKIVAQRIIEAMEKGERDPTRLCIFGLAALEPMIIGSSKDGATESAEVRALFPAA
ncbi:MAG TPA: hypothetical protein VGG11_03805 [Xanthobacteraceae bacterium]